MHLAGMRPNLNIKCIFNIGIRDIDQNYDWINSLKQYYSIANLANIDDFMNQASNHLRNNVREKETELIKYQNLNENQKKVFN